MSQIIQAFLNIVNMSISASFIVLVVLLLRFILKKVPKWITVALWGIVAIRLVCPFFIESELSLIPETEWIEPPQALVSPITPDTIVTDAVIGENLAFTGAIKDAILEKFEEEYPDLPGMYTITYVCNERPYLSITLTITVIASQAGMA